MTRVLAASAAMLLIVALVPGVAAAQTELVDSTSTSVTGAEATATFLRSLDEVSLGSTGATVTLSVDGVSTPVKVDYSELVDVAGLGGENGERNVVAPLLAGWVGLGMASRAGRMLRRLGRLARRDS